MASAVHPLGNEKVDPLRSRNLRGAGRSWSYKLFQTAASQTSSALHRASPSPHEALCVQLRSIPPVRIFSRNARLSLAEGGPSQSQPLSPMHVTTRSNRA